MIYTITLNPAVDVEYTVPAIVMNDVLRAPEARRDFGGKGFNVSRMLRVLGTPSVALGFVGGRNGEMLEDGLRSLEIETDFVIVRGSTRANVSIVTTTQDQHIKVNEPGPSIFSDEIEALKQKISKLASPEDWWVLAGSLPPGVPTDIYADLIKTIQSAGGSVILDTSGPALEAGIRAKPFLVKPNGTEAGTLTGLPVETIGNITRAGSAIAQMGAKNIVISLGKDGALLLGAELSLRGFPPNIKEHNPVGAGDAMVAGLVHSFSNRGSETDALAWGLACGAAAASQPGTQMGDRNLIHQLKSKTKIEELQHAH